jgi:aminoglycoside phosphotransferase (APT) family kinase protein
MFSTLASTAGGLASCPVARLHPDQVDTSADLVRRLLADQFPEWAGRPVARVQEFGTDHHLYRLGDDLVARLPIIGWAVPQAATDARWLPELAPHVPAALPVPVAVGEPGHGYPFPWAVVPWLPGANPDGTNADPADLAGELAAFVRALHAVDATAGPPRTGTGRGTPLVGLDEDVRATLAASPRLAPVADRVLAVWEDAVNAPPYDGPPVWLHGDLMAGNLLVEGGHLSAVIDWGGLGTGDPAPDLCPGFWLFEGAERQAFKEAVGYDEAAWRRARGWIVAPSVTGVDYYAETFPAMSERGLAGIRAVIEDLGV